MERKPIHRPVDGTPRSTAGLVRKGADHQQRASACRQKWTAAGPVLDLSALRVRASQTAELVDALAHLVRCEIGQGVDDLSAVASPEQEPADHGDGQGG